MNTPASSHSSKAQRFLFRLVINVCEQLLLPAPVSFTIQAIKDFKSLYIDMSDAERLALSNEIGQDSVALAQALETRLREEGWANAVNHQELSDLSRLLFEVLREAPPPTELMECLEVRIPESWRTQSDWSQLSHSNHDTNTIRVARRALAQTWLNMGAWGENSGEMLLKELPPPNIEGLFVHPSILGRGARSLVYHASPQSPKWQDLLAEHQVSSIAIKVGLLEAPIRFHREVEVMRSTWGEMLCPALDAGTIEAKGTQKARYWIAMPNYGGLTLEHLIAQNASLEIKLGVMLSCLQGLCTLHERNIAHRDVKPANVLVTTQLKAKLSDFGLARSIKPQLTVDEFEVESENINEGSSEYTSLDLEATQTRFGEPLGTPAYMSPEQLVSSKSVSIASDVWSFAVMLYEVITGIRFFPQASVPEVWGAILHTKLEIGHPSIPQELLPLLKACLKRDVSERISSAISLKKQYEEALTLVIQKERFERHKQAWTEVLKQEAIPQATHSFAEKSDLSLGASALLEHFHDLFPATPELDQEKLSRVLWQYFKAFRQVNQRSKQLQTANEQCDIIEQKAALEINEGLERFTKDMTKEEAIAKSDEVTQQRRMLEEEARHKKEIARQQQLRAQEALNNAKNKLNAVLPNSLQDAYPSYERWRHTEDERIVKLQQLRQLSLDLEYFFRTFGETFISLVSLVDRTSINDLKEAEVTEHLSAEFFCSAINAPRNKLNHTFIVLFAVSTPTKRQIKKSVKELKSIEPKSNSHIKSALDHLMTHLAIGMDRLNDEINRAVVFQEVEDDVLEVDGLSQSGQEIQIERQKALEHLKEIEIKSDSLIQRLRLLYDLIPQATPTNEAIALVSPTPPQPVSESSETDEEHSDNSLSNSLRLKARLATIFMICLAHPGLWLGDYYHSQLNALGGAWTLILISSFFVTAMLIPTVLCAVALCLLVPTTIFANFIRIIYDHLLNIDHVQQSLSASVLFLIIADILNRAFYSNRHWLARLTIQFPIALTLCVILIQLLKLSTDNTTAIDETFIELILSRPHLLVCLPFVLMLIDGLQGKYMSFSIFALVSIPFFKPQWTEELSSIVILHTLDSKLLSYLNEFIAIFL